MAKENKIFAHSNERQAYSGKDTSGKSEGESSSEDDATLKLSAAKKFSGQVQF